MSDGLNAGNLSFGNGNSITKTIINRGTIEAKGLGTGSGGYLYFLVRLPYAISCRSVRYEIYKVDRYGYESYSNTIYQDTERDWTWFWKEVTFYDDSKYNVYVYDCYDYLLTSGSLRIQYR